MKVSDEHPIGVDLVVSKPITLAGFREALARVRELSATDTRAPSR
jgi:hypothetical protein